MPKDRIYLSQHNGQFFGVRKNTKDLEHRKIFKTVRSIILTVLHVCIHDTAMQNSINIYRASQVKSNLFANALDHTIVNNRKQIIS